MRTLAIILILAVVAFGGWLSFELIGEVLRLYRVADSDLKLGVITAGGSALTFVINNAVQSSRERRARLFETKREAYGGFFTSFTSFFHRISQGEEIPQDEMMRAIQTLSTDVMTWGSAETINAFNQYQRVNAAPAKDQKELFLRTETFLRALRKDLGHNDASLKSLALTKLLVRGDEHDKLG